MTYKITWGKEGINFQFFGDVTASELHDANNEIYGDHRFDDIKYFIWDMTGAKNLEMIKDEAEISVYTDHVATSYKRSLKGAFVANDKHVRKIIKHYIDKSIKLGSTWELNLFYKTEDAKEWISS